MEQYGKSAGAASVRRPLASGKAHGLQGGSHCHVPYLQREGYLLPRRRAYGFGGNGEAGGSGCPAGCHAFLREASSMAVPVAGNSNLPLAVVFTSGTTGKAKGIVHTNRSYIALSVQYQCNGYPFKRGDSFLYMIPSFIAAGLSYTLFAPLAQGITMILDPLYDAKQFVADIVKYKPNIIPGTKSFWYAAMNDIRMQNVDLSNLKIPVTGGEPVFVRDEANINRFLSEHKCRKKL